MATLKRSAPKRALMRVLAQELAHSRQTQTSYLIRHLKETLISMLTPQEYTIYHILETKGPHTIRDITRLLKWPRAPVRLHLAHMVDIGLVQRTRHDVTYWYSCSEEERAL